MVKILHVDDNPYDRELTEANLISLDKSWRIKGVDTGVQALELMETQHFDCILSDYQMPGMNGIQLLSALREQGYDIPFVFFTGQGNERLAAEALRAGADEYYIKDIGVALYERLFNSIRKVVEAFRERQERRRAIDALEESERQYRTTLNSIGEAIHVVNRDFQILLFSDAFKGIADKYGFNPNAMDKNLFEVFPFLGEEVRKEYEHVFRTGKMIETEDINLLDGENVITNTRKIPVFQDGKVVRVVTILKDTTQARNSEHALRKSEKKYRILFESASDAIFTLDIERHIIDCNRRALELFNCDSPDQMLSKTPEDFSQGILPNGSRVEDRLKEIDKLLEEGKPVFFEWSPVRMDGTTFDAEVTLTRVAIGDELFVQSIVRDISERKKSEQALRESEKKYRNLFETMTQGVVYQDSTGKIISANPAAERILGLNPDQLKRRSSDDPLCKAIRQDCSDYPREQRPAMVSLRTGKPVKNVIMGINVPSEDKYRWILVDAVPQYRQGENKPYQVYTIFSDITESKQTEEQLRESRDLLEQRTRELKAANEELEAFSSSVSHDLRAPLRHIEGFSEALLFKYKDNLDRDGQHYLERLQDATKQMHQLIEDLLKLSHITLGSLHRKRVDLSTMAKEVVSNLENDEPARKVECRIKKGIVTFADEGLLRLVLENLLGNAWKFTLGRRKAIIEFSEERIKGEMTFFIRDNGVGFRVTDADRLFTPFRRLHDAKKFPGTGVGLATVRRIVKRHGGHVWAEGRVNKGATFYFTLGR